MVWVLVGSPGPVPSISPLVVVCSVFCVRWFVSWLDVSGGFFPPPGGLYGSMGPGGSGCLTEMAAPSDSKSPKSVGSTERVLDVALLY
jgi:hypothetical protein